MLHNPEYRLKSRSGQDRSVNHRTTLERLTRASQVEGYTVCSHAITDMKRELTHGRESASVMQEAPNAGESFNRDIIRFRLVMRGNGDFIDPRFAWQGNDGSVTS